MVNELDSSVGYIDSRTSNSSSRTSEDMDVVAKLSPDSDELPKYIMIGVDKYIT